MLNFICFLFALGGDPQSQSLQSWVPTELRDAAAYDVFAARTKGSFESLTLTRISDHVRISIEVRKSSPATAARRIVYQEIMTNRVERPISGYPLGRQCLIVSWPGAYNLDAVNQRELLKVVVNGPMQRSGGFAWLRKDDFSKEAAWIESIARQVLSNYAERRIGAIGTVTVGAKAVSSFVASGSNVRYVDVESWAAAKGMTVMRNDAEHRVGLLLNGVPVVFALGSDGVKVGSEWKWMSDVMIAHNGRYWVPKGSVE